MEMTTEEFVTRFHSLNGITIGERRKNLFHLLDSIEQAESSEIDFSCLHPKTPLEEKFKVETLLRFRKIADLVEIFKSENNILIKRVLKDSSWFVEEAFQNMSSEELVTLLFPYISFSAKANIINKLAVYLKDSQQADAFFEAVENKYGLFLASKLLCACSPGVIINSLKSKRIKLTQTQMLVIIKNHPEITESLLKILSNKKIQVCREYKNIFVYLAGHNIALFLKLHKEYNFSFHLGWRITEKFVLANRQEVIKYPKNYYNVLHNRQIAKTLNRDFEHLYFNLFPKSLEDLEKTYDAIVSKLVELPEKRRDVNLLLTTFQKLYGTQLWDHPKFINAKLLMMLPPNERYSRFKIEYKPAKLSENEWMCYSRTEESIPFLKKAISLTSKVNIRENLVRLLVETCHINKDLAALENVCQYMLIKHRNDSKVRKAFLLELVKNISLEDLEEQHWTSINELNKLFSLRNYYWFYYSDCLLEAYIHFRLRHNLPVRVELIEWIKCNEVRLNLITKEPRYEKKCLLLMRDIIPEIFTNKDDIKYRELRKCIGENITDPLKHYTSVFVLAILSWNERNPEDQMLLFSFPSAMDYIKNGIKSGDMMSNRNVEDVIKYCLHLKTNAQEREELIIMYLNSKPFFELDLDILDWLLRYEPLTVISSIENIMRNGILKGDCFQRCSFWMLWRNYAHLEVFQDVINICLSEFEKANDYLRLVANTDKEAANDEDDRNDSSEDKDDSNDFSEDEDDYFNETHIRNALVGLSHFMFGDEFIKLVAPFYPVDLRANAKDKKSVKQYQIQQIIGECLRNLHPPSTALDSILIFSKGDYLKLIYNSLYSVVGKANQDKLPPFCEELAKRAVSVRKHVLHLAFRVLSKEQVYTVINRFTEIENNASIRKFIFKVVFNYFVMNPEDRFWELVKSSVNAVDKTDIEVLKIFMETQKIPRQFIVKYIMFAWDFLNKLPYPEKDMDGRRCALLCLIDSDIINSFSNEFCDPIIENHFFKSVNASLTNLELEVLRFTCRYIIHCNCSVEQEKRLRSKFDVVSDFVLTNWNKVDTREESRECVGNFLKSFCEDFLNDSCHNADILTKFANLWTDTFKLQDCFDDCLYLQLTLIYVEKLTLPQVGRKLVDLCNSVTNLFGLAAIQMLCQNLNSFTCHFVKGMGEVKEENFYILIESLLEASDSIACLLVVIFLLHELKQDTPETKIRYNVIIEKLEKNPEPVLQVYLQSYFKGEVYLQSSSERSNMIPYVSVTSSDYDFED